MNLENPKLNLTMFPLMESIRLSQFLRLAQTKWCLPSISPWCQRGKIHGPLRTHTRNNANQCGFCHPTILSAEASMPGQTLDTCNKNIRKNSTLSQCQINADDSPRSDPNLFGTRSTTKTGVIESVGRPTPSTRPSRSSLVPSTPRC